MQIEDTVVKAEEKPKQAGLKPMRGFFSMLSPEQRAAVRGYKGADGVKPFEFEEANPKAVIAPRSTRAGR